MQHKFVDLSHNIAHGMITYKGLPAPVISDFWSREYSQGLYEEGTSFHIAKIEMVANTGTYLDVPFHRYSEAMDLSSVPLEKLANLEGVCLSASYSNQLDIGPEIFKGIDLRNKAVLINTQWSEKWGKEEYQWNHPFLTRDTAEYLVSQKPNLVGIDSCNIDDTRGKLRPVHSLLLQHEILIVEHLCNLNMVEGRSFRFFGIPPKIIGVGSFPIRAFALL